MRSDDLLRAIAEYIISSGREQTQEARAKIRAILDSSPSSEFHLDDNVETATRRVLLELGAPAKLKGYIYCVRAITMVASDSGANKKMMSLYREVGSEFGVPGTSVERCMKNLVDAVLERCPLEVQYKYFGNSIHPDTGLVTVGEFIKRLAGYIRERV